MRGTVIGWHYILANHYNIPKVHLVPCPIHHTLYVQSWFDLLNDWEHTNALAVGLSRLHSAQFAGRSDPIILLLKVIARDSSMELCIQGVVYVIDGWRLIGIYYSFYLSFGYVVKIISSALFVHQNLNKDLKKCLPLATSCRYCGTNSPATRMVTNLLTIFTRNLYHIVRSGSGQAASSLFFEATKSICLVENLK